MSFKRLLAKSAQDPQDPLPLATLQGHTGAVCQAARVLLAEQGAHVLAALGLGAELEPRLRAITLWAAFMHDLGKCSEHFQGMVQRTRSARQLMRHEALSMWLCWPGQPLAPWLSAGGISEPDYLLAVVAAAGHHRKFKVHALAPEENGAGSEVRLLSGHPDFAKVLQIGARALSLAAPPTCLDRRVSREEMEVALVRWYCELNRAGCDRTQRALLAAAKALLIASDVAGSVVARGASAPAAFIPALLRQRADGAQLRGIAMNRLEGNSPRPFQEAVASSTASVTFVRAGCGSGKTVAAYLWAAQYGGRQLWVTYPTTGTATEGFRDYVLSSDVPGDLVHGRAQVDCELLGLHEDGFAKDSHAQAAAKLARDFSRLESLAVWGRPVVVATVDTLLGLVRNKRRGLYAFPSIVHAAAVFDEVHAYDDLMFSALVQMIRDLPGVPVLLMTASLPADRLARLRDAVRETHGTPLREVNGPYKLEHLPRYRLEMCTDPRQRVAETLARGGKVLWVSNTVERCIAAADACAEFNPYLYHSRFRYEDRVVRHGEAIAAFKGAGAALLCSTQVAEMSLDLSADLLVTDLAPVPALIQRLGRLNRRSTTKSPLPIAAALLVPVESSKPYTSAELSNAYDWTESLLGRELSQADLVAAWSQFPGVAAEEDGSEGASWMDGGFDTVEGDLREGSSGVTVLLEADREAVKRGLLDPVRAALPMSAPKSRAWLRWPREGYLPVAPAAAIDYDPLRGGRWRREA